MNQSLEEKLKSLERKIAVKNAYLTVQFSFPKGNKIPADVKEQVENELKNACAMLADDAHQDVASKQSERLTDDEIVILRQVVDSIRSKTGSSSLSIPAVQKETAPSPEAPEAAPKHPVSKKTFDASVDGVKKATILTLENVDPKYRSRINPEESVFVSSIREDGYARISVQRTGLSINVPVEDLDFNVK